MLSRCNYSGFVCMIFVSNGAGGDRYAMCNVVGFLQNLIGRA
jgi:hypothetical protein